MMKNLLCVLGICTLSGVCVGQSSPGTTFESWATYISAANTPPSSVVYQTGDAELSWTAPDGRTIELISKIPHPAEGAPTVTLGAYTPGQDARPVFDAALASVKSLGAGKLVIPENTYTFLTAESSSTGHLLLSGLNNVVIDGGGSTFVFTQVNTAGIFIEECIGMELTNFSIQYSVGRNLTYVGHMSSTAPYTLTAVTGNQYSLSGADAQISKMYPYSGTASAPYQRGGIKVVPTGTTSFSGGGITNTSFTSAMATINAGTAYEGDYVVMEDTAGGHAIEVKDEPQNGALQTSDLTIDHVTINSGPGMGIAVLGLARGLTVQYTQITPLSTGVVSTEYDGMHVTQAGGDVYLQHNQIFNQGDDGINLAFPIQFAYSVNAAGTQVGLANFSRLIQANDTLSFFDRQNNYLGSVTVSGTPVQQTCPSNLQSPTNYTPCELVTLSGAIPNFNPANFVADHLYVRDANLAGGRMALVGNTIDTCACHGILEQDPNALVENNSIANITDNGIRLLSNLGEPYTFQEGVGAINVLVTGNNVSETGVDNDIPGGSGIPYAAISVMGVWANGLLMAEINNGVTTNMVNYNVNVTGNTITDSDQDCILINSGENVNVTSNACNYDNATTSGSPSIYVYYATPGSVESNTREGTTTGPITVSHAPNFTVQTTY